MVTVRKIMGILSVGILSACLLAGCGSDSSAANDRETTADIAGVLSEDADHAAKGGDGADAGYVFESGGTEIKVDTDMAELADALGEPDKYYEEPSCAAQGIAKIYTYPGFVIETYPDGERDLIACVVIKDDSVATPEGVDLSMEKDDIIEAYGSDYEESENSMVYEKNGTKLRFILAEDGIESIEYDSPVLN